MKFIKLMTRAPSLFLHYVKISKSFDFMLRYIVLGVLYILNTLFFGKLEKIINKIHPLFYKMFIFNTSFGIYIGETVNHRTVLDPDYEPSLRKIINSNYKKNNKEEKIFINIGAHIGRYAIELTKNYGYTTYAFEPSPETYKILKLNTVLSNVEERISIFNYALGDKETEMFFDYNKDNDASSKIIQNISSNKLMKVNVKAFDGLSLDIDIKKVRLVIMDVEGFEYQVLQGMKEFLKNVGSLDFIIEIMDDQKDRQNTIDFMHTYGYKSQKIDRDNYHFWK